MFFGFSLIVLVFSLFVKGAIFFLAVFDRALNLPQAYLGNIPCGIAEQIDGFGSVIEAEVIKCIEIQKHIAVLTDARQHRVCHAGYENGSESDFQIVLVHPLQGTVSCQAGKVGEVVGHVILNRILTRGNHRRDKTAVILQFSEPILQRFGYIIVIPVPQEISNHPEVIRRLGVIAINTVIEADIYGNTNSSYIDGCRLMNGVGGSGDYCENAGLSIFITKSTAKDGTLSCIVPQVSHVDHTIHEIHALITEQGVADLRGLDPVERANLIIDKCAHPKFRKALHEYLDNAESTCKYKENPVDMQAALNFEKAM